MSKVNKRVCKYCSHYIGEGGTWECKLYGFKAFPFESPDDRVCGDFLKRGGKDGRVDSGNGL